MKNLLLTVVLCSSALLCTTGCRTCPTAVPAALTYEYVAQVLAMPSCTATVEQIGPCYAHLVTADGRQLYFGSPGAASEVVDFIHTLQEGKAYFLPDAFMTYQETRRAK